MYEVFFLISQILKDNESTGECYRPKLKVDNTFQNCDCSGYHENPNWIFIVLFCVVTKNFSNGCFWSKFVQQFSGLNGARVLCRNTGSTSLKPEERPCKCQPGFELKNFGGSLECKACEKGLMSSGLKCERCPAGHVALAGKHYYIWRNSTLPEGFKAKCAGDCSVKVGLTLWQLILSWGLIRMLKDI